MHISRTLGVLHSCLLISVDWAADTESFHLYRNFLKASLFIIK